MGVECSIVVPLSNSRERLFRLHRRVEATLRQLAMPYEIIYVDDGSADGVAADIQLLHDEDPAVRGIMLSRPFGREAAVWAGLEAANGRAVIILGGDLRQPPEIIPDLVAAWQQDGQVVRASARQSDDAVQHTTTMVQWLLPIGRLHHYFATREPMLLVDRNVLRHLLQIRQHDRRIDDLCRWAGFNQRTITYDIHDWPLERQRSSWTQIVSNGIHRAWSRFRPMAAEAVGRLGIAIVAITMFGSVFGASASMVGYAWSIHTWIALAVAAVAGMNLMAMGILAEYLARTSRETDARPLYITRERLGIRPHPRLVPNVLDWIDDERTEHQERATAGMAEDRFGRLNPPGTIN